MDNYTDQKPKTSAGSMGSYSTLAYIVIALVLIFGALLLYTNNWGTTTPVPTAAQDSTTPPAAETTEPPASGTAPQPPVVPAQ